MPAAVLVIAIAHLFLFALCSSDRPTNDEFSRVCGLFPPLVNTTTATGTEEEEEEEDEERGRARLFVTSREQRAAHVTLPPSQLQLGTLFSRIVRKHTHMTSAAVDMGGVLRKEMK